MQLTQKNKEKLKEIISNQKRVERVSKKGIREIFLQLKVDISDAYLEYMMCKIYEPSTREGISYLEVFDMFQATEYENFQAKNEAKTKKAQKKSLQGEGFQKDQLEEREKQATPFSNKKSQEEGYYSDHFEEE